MDTAFRYAEKNSMETEGDYPYKAKRGTCEAVASKGVFKVHSYSDVKADSPESL